MAAANVLAAACIPDKPKLTHTHLSKPNNTRVWLSEEWSTAPSLGIIGFDCVIPSFWYPISSPHTPHPVTNKQEIILNISLSRCTHHDQHQRWRGRAKANYLQWGCEPPQGCEWGSARSPRRGVSRALLGSIGAQGRRWWQLWWPWGGRLVNLCTPELPQRR